MLGISRDIDTGRLERLGGEWTDEKRSVSTGECLRYVGGDSE